MEATTKDSQATTRASKPVVPSSLRQGELIAAVTAQCGRRRRIFRVVRVETGGGVERLFARPWKTSTRLWGNVIQVHPADIEGRPETSELRAMQRDGAFDAKGRA